MAAPNQDQQNVTHGNVIHLDGPPPLTEMQLRQIAIGLEIPTPAQSQRLALDLCQAKGIRVP